MAGERNDGHAGEGSAKCPTEPGGRATCIHLHVVSRNSWQTGCMPDVRETNLPGVGVRHEFTTSDGTRIGVLVHRDGRREILVYDRKDPDACSERMQLSASDTQTLSELLGASQVSEAVRGRPAADRRPGDRVDRPRPTSPLVGHTIADGQLRTRTGASVVAVVRGDTTVPAPGPDLAFEPRDVVVAVGTADGLATLRDPRSTTRSLIVLAAGTSEAALAFIEIGAVALALAVLARLAGRLGITAIPLYLLAGLAVGEGGVVPLDVSAEFISSRRDRRAAAAAHARSRVQRRRASHRPAHRARPGRHRHGAELTAGLRRSACCSAGSHSPRCCSAGCAGSARPASSPRSCPTSTGSATARRRRSSTCS